MLGVSIDEAVESYARYLHDRLGARQAERYARRYRQDPQSPRAEAAMFSWAQANDLNPEIAELPSMGGMDFISRPAQGSAFELEVTAIGVQAAADKSKLPTQSDGPHAQFYSLITKTLAGRVRSKRDQLAKSKKGLPRAIALASEHPMAELFLDRTAAVSLLLSDTFVSHTITDEGLGEGVEATDLKNSPFLRPNPKNPTEIISINREVSAVFLAPITRYQVRPVGILHPNAIHPFDIFSLPLVPLLRLDEWPVREGRLVTRWTWESDPPYPSYRRIA